jgi:hypothetical protein
MLSSVVHPHLGITWFRKVDPIRATQATTLFEHVYQEYKHQYGPKTTAQPQTLPKQSASSNSFLDALCLVDVAIDETSVPSVSVTEFDRFLAIDPSFGIGSRDYPLLWWKVHSVHLYFI